MKTAGTLIAAESQKKNLATMTPDNSDAETPLLSERFLKV